MEKQIFKVSEIRNAIKESTTEFKPVLGNNVEKDSKKNNDEAYKESGKKIEKYQKETKSDLKQGDKSVAGGENRDMSSIVYDSVDDGFKKRTTAQLKGYDHAEAEKNKQKDEYGNADFGDKDTVKVFKDKAKAVKDDKDELKTSGLVGQTLDKEKVKKQTDTMFENKKTKRLVFKHTRFLGENHMKTFIPDEYKEDGNKFMMKDNNDNEYLVEWSNGGADVLSYTNKKVVNEQFEHIQKLMNYNSGDFFKKTTTIQRESADKTMADVLNIARNLKK